MGREGDGGDSGDSGDSGNGGNGGEVVGVGIASWDMIGVASHDPMLGAKQPLAQLMEAGGGPVATALVTLARLGVGGRLISAVGDDGYGSRIIADLEQEGVATDTILVAPGGSHVAFALVEPLHGRRTVWWHNDRQVFATLAETLEAHRQTITAARALLLDTHLPEAGLVAARWMREAGGIVMIDAERYSDNAAALLPLCTAVVVSQRFGREATGEDDPDRAARALYDRCKTLVVVTGGEAGCWCVSADEAFHMPAFCVDVLDTTGAGDVFHGGFLYGLLQGWPLREVARFASATAALKCRAYGGRAGIPRLLNIRTLLEDAEE